MPISINPTKSTDLTYTGFFTITESTPSTTAYAIFSGRDIAGNRGTEIDAGASILIDTDGPAVNRLIVFPISPIKNNSQTPAEVQVTLPKMSVSLAEDARLKRGIMNRLAFEVENRSGQAVTHAALKINIDGKNHTSETFSINAQETKTIPVVVGGYSDLPDVADLTATLEITPNGGELVKIIRTSFIEVDDGMLILQIFNEEFTRGATGKVGCTVPVKTVTFTYDNAGNLTGYDDGTTSGIYDYDNAYRKISETVNFGPFVKTNNYGYYKNGLKQTFTGPDSVAYGYLYDANNQLTGVQIPNLGFVTVGAYQWNRPTSITLPGGSTRQYQYDPLMRVKSIVAKDPGQNNLLNYQYTYDKMDYITDKTTEHGNYVTTTMMISTG